MTETVAPPSPLDHDLSALDLPVRAVHWADRTGISTVRELLAWHPELFAKERNVGRRTVRETRERLEAHLGCTWEQACAALRGGSFTAPAQRDGEEVDGPDGVIEALTAGGVTGWTSLAARLTDEARALPLLDVELPTRMKNFVEAEGLHSVGELFELSYESLIERPNIGRKSLNDTLGAVRERLRGRISFRGTEQQDWPEPAPTYTTFLELWHAELGGLEPVPRMIMTRRAGMLGSRETLEEIGAMLGVTRERVRQIEVRVVERLRERPSFRGVVQAHLQSAFGAARAVSLHTLAHLPWWVGIDKKELVLDYLVRRIFDGELFLLKAPSGRSYLTKFPGDALDAAVDRAKQGLRVLDYPVESGAVAAVFHNEADALDPALFVELEHSLNPWLLRDPQEPSRVLGFGRQYDDEVIAFLNAQAAPVPIATLLEHCGRGGLPEEVLYFKRGVVGLKRHFPDFDHWTERLVPAAIAVMNELPAGRQWLVPEIHELLVERALVPEWLGHWHLASLLRLSGRVDYLGRLRVALKDSGGERLEYEDLLEEILDAAGGPLPFDELLARARERTDVSQGAALVVREAPFVRLDETRIGLVERDIPGGPAAVALAVEAVVRALTAMEHGLTQFQVTALVRRLSDDHACWTPELVSSVLRSEATLHIDRSQNVGLEDWGDTRCPGRAAFIRREVQKAGGTLRLDVLNERFAQVYGKAPDRSTLGVLARAEGLDIDSEGRVRRVSELPEPPASRAAFNLSGIPAELREMFSELTEEPFWSLTDLSAQVDEHVAALEREHQRNEFVDVTAAKSLGRQSRQLLERWDSLSLPDRQLAHAAIRYFVSWHDVENDLDIGGLDDDKAIMNAVLAHLGLEEENVTRAG